MTPRDQSRAQGFARDCGELATAVAIARATIDRGGTADLEALANRLDELLAAIQASPAADGPTHVPQLLGLAEEIEALGGAIGEACRRCSDELARGGTSARAAAAYIKSTLG